MMDFIPGGRRFDRFPGPTGWAILFMEPPRAFTGELLPGNNPLIPVAFCPTLGKFPPDFTMTFPA